MSNSLMSKVPDKSNNGGLKHKTLLLGPNTFRVKTFLRIYALLFVHLCCLCFVVVFLRICIQSSMQLPITRSS